MHSHKNLFVVYLFIYFLEFYILATLNIISGRVPTCDTALSWQLHSATLLGDQAARVMTWYPTQSHYAGIGLTSPCPLLIMPSVRIGSDNYQFCVSLVWLEWESNFRPSVPEACALPIRWPHLVYDFVQWRKLLLNLHGPMISKYFKTKYLIYIWSYIYPI